MSRGRLVCCRLLLEGGVLPVLPFWTGPLPCRELRGAERLPAAAGRPEERLLGVKAASSAADFAGVLRGADGG